MILGRDRRNKSKVLPCWQVKGLRRILKVKNVLAYLNCINENNEMLVFHPNCRGPHYIHLAQSGLTTYLVVKEDFDDS